jgi:hypothetical protein
MAEKKQKGKVIELAGKTFDSQNGELSLGDMEELEHKGVDLMKMTEGQSLSVSKTRIVSQVCLNKANPDAKVDDAFMAAIPASQISDLGEFVGHFFTKSFPDKKGKS